MSSANGSSSYATPLSSSSVRSELEVYILAEQKRILEQIEQARQQQQQQLKSDGNHSGCLQQTHTSSTFLQNQGCQYLLEGGCDSADIELASYPRKLAAATAATAAAAITSADSVVTASATSATLLEDDWSLNWSLSSASTRRTTADEKLRREQQKQLEFCKRQKEQEDLVRKASNASSASSGSRLSASARSATTRQRPSYAALKTEQQDAGCAAHCGDDDDDDQSMGSCSGSNLNHSRRNSRVRSRHDIEFEKEQLELYRLCQQQHQEQKQIHQHKHGYSLPPILNHQSDDEEDVERGMTHAHSADLEGIIRSQRQIEEFLHHQSLSDIAHRSPSGTDLDPTSPSCSTRPLHASMPAASMSSLVSHLHNEDSNGNGTSPQEQRRERRHESREEYLQKRAALPPTINTTRRETASVATAAAAAASSHPRVLSSPQSPSELQEWNDAEAKRQMQSPQVVEALQAEQQRSAAQSQQQQSPSSSELNSNRNNNDESHNNTGNDRHNDDVEPGYVITKLPPFNSSRMMRKTASGGGNGSREMNSGGATCEGGGGDYIAEGHEYVGAYVVTTVGGNPTVRPRPPLQQQPSEDYSTITHSVSTNSTRRSIFADEPSQRSATEACQEPPPLPIHGIVVSNEPTAQVARVRITVASKNNSNNPNGDNRHQTTGAAGYQKSNCTYFMGGFFIFAALGGIAFGLSSYFGFVDLSDHDENADHSTPLLPTPIPTSLDPSEPTAAPVPGPTLAPTQIVLDLPEYTVRAIHGFDYSPQAQAYKWLLEDLEYQDRPVPRLLQRFALVTLYYATNSYYDDVREGNGATDKSWKRTTGWLDHAMDECDWETTESDLETAYRVCDPETGMFESLILPMNGLKGHLPPELSLISTLKYVDFERNDFGYAAQGIPTELGLLSNLEQFRLYSSYTKGIIPTEIGMWTNLKRLEFRSNLFENSHIPSEVGLMTNLESFELARCQLAGTIPPELAIPLREKLFYIDLEYNSLTGTIPEELNEALTARKDQNGGVLNTPSSRHFFEVNFASNYMTGVVPGEFCSLQQNFLKFTCDPEKGLCGCYCECSP